MFLLILAALRVAFGQELTGFTLIDASSNEVIRNLSDGDVIDLDVDGDQLNIRADVSTGAVVGSVQFNLDGTDYVRTESVAPYALSGDIEGDYSASPEIATLGEHSLTAIIYSEANGGGLILDTASISFTTIESPSPCVQVPEAQDVQLVVRNSGMAVSFQSNLEESIVVQRTISEASSDEISWRMEPTGTGKHYHIVNPRTGYAINVFRARQTEGAQLIAYPASESAENDNWCFRNAGDGYFYIEAQHSGLVMDVEDQSTESGSPVVQWPNGGGTNQQFQIVSVPIATFDVTPYNHGRNGVVSGETRTWHKVTLGFDGPSSSETANPNPFTDFRLEVTFTNGPHSFTVPGYFAADGNAANSGATSGNVWLVHFTPNAVGRWNWLCSFRQGQNVAQNGGGLSAAFMDGFMGHFDVEATDKMGRDHRAKGRLEYVDQHYLRFAETQDWFLKVGADSPENFFAYEDFDNTPNEGGRRKSWSPHLGDYQLGNPTWKGGKGRALIGALNYLALEKGMNAFSFLPMNIAGDDKNVFPYISDNPGTDRLRIDVSKTAQWEVILEYADSIGLYIHFKTQETENDQLLDGGSLGDERKLYYRELIARFGHHLALNWNLGEENTNTDSQRKSFADYFKDVDPYDSIVVVHTFPSNEQREEIYGQLLAYPTFDGVSIQSSPSLVYSETLKWTTRSAQAGRKWVVANDEQANAQTGVMPDDVDFDHDVIRTEVLWGNIMAGGAGVEYYFGYGFPNSDLTCQDFRSRANMWTISKYALDFFEQNEIPFWSMSSCNDLVSSSSTWCLGNSEVFLLYLREGGTTDVELPDGSSYSVQWYDPRNGGSLQDGSVTSVEGGSGTIGLPPDSATRDWAVLITAITGCPPGTFAIPGGCVCFSGRSLVQTYDRGLVALKDLQIGDLVDVGGTYEPIYSFGHLARHGSHVFIALNDLEVSPAHMVAVNGQGFIPASAVRLGDHLISASGKLVEVMNISRRLASGAYAPFTPSGKIVVNGVVASCYISMQSKSGKLILGGMTTGISWQSIAHIFELPHRLLCYHAGLCEESYTEEGLSTWVAVPFNVASWLTK